MFTNNIVNMICNHPGCKEQRECAGTKPNGQKFYRAKCRKHYREELYKKRGFDTYYQYQNSLHPYRKERKGYCENIDGRLGYICTTTILIEGQLDVDHIDGDPSNNNKENLQTLCSCCHEYKTYMEKDYLTKGRKSLGVSSR